MCGKGKSSMCLWEVCVCQYSKSPAADITTIELKSLSKSDSFKTIPAPPARFFRLGPRPEELQTSEKDRQAVSSSSYTIHWVLFHVRLWQVRFLCHERIEILCVLEGWWFPPILYCFSVASGLRFSWIPDVQFAVGMYGLLCESLHDFIKESYGDDVWKLVRERADVRLHSFVTHQVRIFYYCEKTNWK